jgi:molecular chaperone GrpE
MNVMPEWDVTGDRETGVLEPVSSAATAESEELPETGEPPGSGEPERDGAALPDPAASGSSSADGDPRDMMAGIAASVRELADSADRYHARAEQREHVIDHLRDEVDRLRRGERRTLLRPLLVEICQLRNDLLRQAGELPANFDAERAALLLTSYAESVQLTLEHNGVVSFAPGSGDAFDPRMHRRVGAEAAPDAALAGRIAQVRRDGYLDVDANSPIAPAEVVVFAAAAPPSRRDEGEEQ